MKNSVFNQLCTSYYSSFSTDTFPQVHVLGALPLRNLSRLWGYLTSLELPIWFRPFGFRVYSVLFNCNLDEIEHSDDLRQYKSLGDFFYRRLKDGARTIDDAVLVCILNFNFPPSELFHLMTCR
jgi:phosphatidylserine decarboxylase